MKKKGTTPVSKEEREWEDEQNFKRDGKLQVRQMENTSGVRKTNIRSGTKKYGKDTCRKTRDRTGRGGERTRRHRGEK